MYGKLDLEALRERGIAAPAVVPDVSTEEDVNSGGEVTHTTCTWPPPEAEYFFGECFEFSTLIRTQLRPLEVCLYYCATVVRFPPKYHVNRTATRHMCDRLPTMQGRLISASWRDLTPDWHRCQIRNLSPHAQQHHPTEAWLTTMILTTLKAVPRIRTPSQYTHGLFQSLQLQPPRPLRPLQPPLQL